MDSVIENLSDDVTKQWDADRSIYIFTLKNSNRGAIDTYIEGNLETFRNWDKPETIYEIQDVSSSAVNFTPYLKGRLSELADYLEENGISARVAIVVGNSLTAQLIRAYGRVFATHIDNVKQGFFADSAAAEKWLEIERSMA